jgi:phosphatidylinositol kinase/protein kinase (PI-3  family)
MDHGLVQWIPGTDTLWRIIQDNRKGRAVEEWSGLLKGLSDVPFDFLVGVQKLQLLERVFRETSDRDIAEFFWMKAANADIWLKQINNFSISAGITSIVGYVMGLGDRHPDNILIDRVSGRIIHIDFGDCFERAALRKFYPEVVPFRLTRMMVKAMGPAGIHGIFFSSFVNMSSLLRENHRVLVMVLEVFVQEPLQFGEKEQAVGHVTREIMEERRKSRKTGFAASEFRDVQQLLMERVRRRVKQKLTGTDFEEEGALSVERQAEMLVEMATNPYNLSRMWSGWCQFW